jgi:alpha-beta hydrolase superfamily lysophospholipase
VVERRIRVVRTARYQVLGDPSSAEEVWFVVHGYGQLARPFLRWFEALPGAGATRAVVAPEGLSRFYVEDRVGPHGWETRVGASWMTREDRASEIADYVAYLDAVAVEAGGPGGGAAGGPVAGPAGGPVADPRRVVLGFSQGAETASRWAVLGSVRPAELILWGGGLGVDLEPAAMASALAGVRVRLVVGDDDEWGRRRAEETLTRLDAAGVAAERIGYEGGHRMEAAVLRAWG